jgi:CcmD family protein
MQSLNYLVAAYAVIFGLIGIYNITLGTKLSDLQKRVESLEEGD